MLARWIGTGIIAALLAPATVASAQTGVPDLKGSWSGTAEIVHRSEVAEHVDPTAKPSFVTLPFTITIEQQEGRGFAGGLASVPVDIDASHRPASCLWDAPELTACPGRVPNAPSQEQ